MKLNTMGRMVTLADDNKSWPLNNISTNNFSLNSTSLNNSGPPAWILNLRDIELDPPKLIRGNMEVEQKYKNIQKQSSILKLKPGNRIQVINCTFQYLPQKPLWLSFLSLRLDVFLQVFLICLYSLVCLMGLFTNLSLIWVRYNCSNWSLQITIYA